MMASLDLCGVVCHYRWYTLCAFSSWMHVLGSTRLTQISLVSSLLFTTCCGEVDLGGNY